MSKRILITGASGGFGKLTSLSLLEAGHQVVGTMRSTSRKNAEVAKELTDKGVQLVEMDVTNGDSVTQGVERAIQQLGGIDLLINNAGLGVLGMSEHFTAEDMQRLFDVNVFGVQRVTRAVLPHLRAQKNGQLIFVSSLLGRITMPFYGPYNASKWALEALAENYRTELSSFGIEVNIVEPGGYATSFMDALMRPSDQSRDASYGDFMHAPNAMFENFEKALASNPAQDPQNVADAITNLIAMPRGQKPMRTIVDNMGMGAALEGYNEQLDGITRGIYTNFGIGGMLDVQ